MKKLIFPLLVLLVFIGYQFYKMPKMIQGEKALNFSTKLANGKSFSLNQLEGSYVLLDFWGSWCGPCRKESPELVALHQKHADKSFKNAQNFYIVSVAIERDLGRWERAVEKDNLYWEHHICDGKRFKSEIAQLYNIKEIPTKYLIDPSGQVLGVNLPMKEIDDILSANRSAN